MTADDQDDRAGDGLGHVLDGLERLAQDLDARKYPGRAWPVAGRKVLRRPLWRVLVPLGGVAAAAAIAAMLIHYCAVRPSVVVPAPGPGKVIAGGSTQSSVEDPQEAGMPLIVVVEDLDSYSFIDLTGGVPLVSFAARGSYLPMCVVPVLPEPSRATTTGKRT